ncbi:DUF2288 domain-containing protein [Undibacterium sp. Ji50W]|uniref:DUF2288 domain-containing protein n=1 Tax=Undibacterium sp. Ji50W TaxID=3413041 RepID=UPI003BF27139
MSNTDISTNILRTKINLETASFPWSELLRHFAGGTVLVVAGDQDLVEVALHMAEDRAEQIAALLDSGQLARVNDAQAKEWLEQDRQLWTVVVKPWILVQHRVERT